MLSRSIKKVYILLDGGKKGLFSGKFQERLIALFPFLDTYSDIYLLSEDIVEDFSKIKGILEKVALYLKRHSFYRMNIHGVHPLPPDDSLKNIYSYFFNIISPFNKEGFAHQSISRFMILPILLLEGKDEPTRLDSCLDYLRNRLMIPSIYLRKDVSHSVGAMVRSDKERIYLELDGGEGMVRIMNTLGTHSVFDNLMVWANNPVKGPPPGCHSLILLEKDGNIYSCFKALSSNRSVSNIYSVNSPSEIARLLKLTGNRPEDCLRCGVESLAFMKDTLKINHREKEADSISFHLGMEFVKQESYKKALELFDQLLEGRSSFEDMGNVLLSRALCHLQLKEAEKSMAVLEEAERYIPNSPMIYYYRGLCEFHLRDYIEAIDRFHDALKLGPEQLPLGDVYFYTGLSHINIEEYNDGLTMMKRAEKLFMEKSPVYYYMGMCHLGMKNLDTSLHYFKRALLSEPEEEDLGSILFYTGLCYKEMGKYEEAILELKSARDVEKTRKDIHNLLGYCYFKLKKHDKAIQCFMRAVEIDPKSAIDYANIGVNLRAKGEIKKAIPMFKKALRLNPAIGFARKHLEEIYGKT
ncbi:MAG: tetratricopeptide repeat protein [Thermodesulfobacteriota bacterium]|nr:tetratricopeptide repeat protein [Thermodesulfobacteriota bacterium]